MVEPEIEWKVSANAAHFLCLVTSILCEVEDVLLPQEITAGRTTEASPNTLHGL